MSVANTNSIYKAVDLRINGLIHIVVGDYATISLEDVSNYLDNILLNFNVECRVILLSSLQIYDENIWNQTENDSMYGVTNVAKYYQDLENLVKQRINEKSLYILRLPKYTIGFGLELPVKFDMKICQFYDFDFLEREFQMMVQQNIRLLNLVSQPMMFEDISDLYSIIQGDDSTIEKQSTLYNASGYLMTRTEIVNKIAAICKIKMIDLSNLVICQSNWVQELDSKANVILDMFHISNRSLNGEYIKWYESNIHDHVSKAKQKKNLVLNNIFSTTTNINVFNDASTFIAHFCKIIGFAHLANIKNIVFSDAHTRDVSSGILQRDWFDVICESHAKFVAVMQSIVLFANSYQINVIIDKNENANYITSTNDAQIVVQSIDAANCFFAACETTGLCDKSSMIMVEKALIANTVPLSTGTKLVFVKKQDHDKASSSKLINMIGTFLNNAIVI